MTMEELRDKLVPQQSRTTAKQFTDWFNGTQDTAGAVLADITEAALTDITEAARAEVSAEIPNTSDVKSTGEQFAEWLESASVPFNPFIDDSFGTRHF